LASKHGDEDIAKPDPELANLAGHYPPANQQRRGPKPSQRLCARWQVFLATGNANTLTAVSSCEGQDERVWAMSMMNAYKLEGRQRSTKLGSRRQRAAKIRQSRTSQLGDGRPDQDSGFDWRFGLDALVGLIPGFATRPLAGVVLYFGFRRFVIVVPKITLLRWGSNIAIDYLLGSVPVVGDVFDAWWNQTR